MYNLFKFCFLLLAIRRYYFVDCYATGGLIWSHNQQSFIPIDNVSTFAAHRQEFLAKSRKKETHNFQGEVLKLGYFEDSSVVNFYENDTKITGFCGEMWNSLAEYSNFTIATVKVNRTWTENWRTVITMIFLDEIHIIPRISFSPEYLEIMDLTTPIGEARYNLYFRPEWKADANWMFHMFSRQVWFTIVLIFLLLSGIGYLMQNISMQVFDDKKIHHNLHDHMFYTFATLCSQGFTPDTLDRMTKIFCLSKKVFAWLLLIVFSSHLISYMKNRKLQLPFEDIVSLLNETNYKLIIYNGSITIYEYLVLVHVFGLDGQSEFGKRLHWAETQESAYQTTCFSDEKFAIFQLDNTMKTSGNGFCDLVPIGKSRLTTWLTSGILKDFPYKRTFDIGILKMREFGLVNGLTNRWMEPKTIEAEAIRHTLFTPVNLNQVLMLFIILCIGIVASIIIVVLENIVFIYKRKRCQNLLSLQICQLMFA